MSGRQRQTPIHFVVTGPPRSRGAWLANLLTTDRSLCVHDPLAPTSAFRDVPALMMSARRDRCIGISDSGFGMYGEPLIRKYPDTRILIVLRSTADALASFTRVAAGLGISADDAATGFRTVNEARAWMHDIPHATIDFDHIADADHMRRAWDYLIPGIPFNLDRYRALSNLNVTTTFSGALQWDG